MLVVDIALQQETHSDGVEGINCLFNDAPNTFFIYGYMEGRKCFILFLFNDALNIFYLRLYGRKDMVFFKLN